MIILIVGLGSIGKKHLDALHKLKVNGKVYALRSTLNNPIEEGVENVYSLDDVKEKIDFAIISNPTNKHFDYINLLAKRSIPLLIEKPSVDALDGVEDLLRVIEEKKIITYVACNLRFHPCIVYLKEIIRKEVLRVNEVSVYCGSYLPNWRPNRNFREVYSANKSMGGGVHLDLIHEIDYTTWIFGFPSQYTSILRNVSSLNIDAIDYANFNLQYDSFTVNINLNYFRRDTKRQIEIVHENGTIITDLIKNEIRNEKDDIIFKDPEYSSIDSYTAQLDYFMNCLRHDIQPMNSFVESVENLKICLQNE